MLVVANRKLYVAEDPRIDVVEDMLPHANCGACGYPGCRPFAEALVQGQTSPNRCTVSPEDGHVRIANFLGVAMDEQVKRVARLACAGGNHVAQNRARYLGMRSCAAAQLVSGGGKDCFWGCLALGDCVEVCDFDALSLDVHGLPVVDEDACTACGACVDACPKDLFTLEAIENRLWVACKSQQAGDEATSECDVACTACGRCAMDAPTGLITMRDNLPVISYGSNSDTSRAAIERCPTGAIVWLAPNPNGQGPAIPQKGREALTVIRQEPKPAVPS